MSAFFGAIGFVGIIVGIVLMVIGRIKKRKYRGGLITLVAIVLIIISMATMPESQKDTANKSKTKTHQTSEKTPGSAKQATAEKKVTWQEKIKEVAASKGSKTEKFDQISMYAHDYKPTKAEIKDFSNYIIQQYKDKKYIMDINNDEYMLEEIFKANVVERYYDDADQNPLDSFAYDFWQNVKYNYRGVDTMTSDATTANEEQMDKALAKMGK